MSSLLRSTKFVRYFAGAARTLLLNSAKTAEANLLAHTKTSSTAQNVLLRDYATSKKKESLEPLLSKLDSDFRRFGRISKKDIDEIFDEIKAKSDITSSQSLLVIRCCGELVPEELPEQRTLLVQKIWSVLTEIGVPMDISHYNALLQVYIENEHAFSPAAFLEELEKKGLQPNRVTYQRLMWRYCQEGDVEGATKVLEKMRELSLPVSEPVLNALVMGHAFHGDTDGAKAVLQTMAGAGLEPSNKTYALLACGYAKKGDIDEVENIIKTANEKESLMSNKDIHDIIEALATSGHGDKVDRLFEYLHKGAHYNQDICNLILRLLNKNQEHVAKKIMKTMPRAENAVDGLYKGAFFVKHLIKVKKSPEEIIKTCKELQEEGLVPNALYIATESSMIEGLVNLSQELFKELEKSGTEIRQHYYYPLLAKKGQENDEEGLLQLLRAMVDRGLTPSGEALKDYVFPYLKGKPQNVMVKLQIANIPLIYGARSLIIDLLESGNMKDAANITVQYRTYGQYNIMRRPLVQALSKTNDVQSFATILHVMSSGRKNIDEDETEETTSDDTSANEVGNIVKLAIRSTKPDTHEILLDAVLAKGLRISTASAEAIQQYIGENMTSSISEKLTQLTSADLELAPLEMKRSTAGVTNVKNLERLVANAKSKGTVNYKLQRDLLSVYMKQNNVQKVDNYVKDLEADSFEFNMATIAQLVEFYASNNEPDKALEYKNVFEQKFPDVKLHNYKLVYCAEALVNSGRFDEAINLLKDNKKQELEEDGSFTLNSRAWHLLNILAESKDQQKVLDMTTTLIENNYVEPSNVILGPSIKVHLLNDDLEGALKQFEYCTKQYRTTPWKGEIMKALILKEDATKLQWVADVSTQIHGEVNILHDLVLAFVECGRLRQARRILETPGLHTKNKRLDDACRRYVEDGKPEHLEGLLEATKDLSNIDRSKLFYHLLVSYCKANETDKAVGLWTILQEEGEVPSEEFLSYLAKHLKEKGKPIPFAVPESPKHTVANDTPKAKPTPAKKAPSTKQTQQITKNDATETVNQLVLQGKTVEALHFTLKCIDNQVYPKSNAIKFMLKHLAEKGDVESIETFGRVIEQKDTLRRNVTYDDKLTLAIFNKGKGSEHLEELSKNVLQAKSNDELEKALTRFPRSNALASIVENEALLAKCQQVVEYAATKNIMLPANLLWMELILAGKDNAANELWNKSLCNASTIAYRRLLQEAHVRNDTQLVEKLLTALKGNKNITDNTIGNVYSRLINQHLYHKKTEEAKKVLDRAISEHIQLDCIGKTTLKRLKSALEAEGQEFNHPIPA